MARTDDSDRRPLNRRAFLRLLAVSGGAGILAACGGSPQAPSAISPTAAASGAADAATAPAADAATAPATVAAAATAPAAVAASGAQVTVSWFNPYTTKTTQEVLPKIIAEFEQQNPNIKIDYQNPGGAGAGGNYNEALLSRIAGGDAPDVATLPFTPAEFAARGSLVAIDDYMRAAKTAKADAFFEAPLKSCQWQGKTYGLPSSAGAGAIYMNTAMFKTKNISTDRSQFPKTWDDLQQMSKEFVIMENGVIKQAGFVPFVGSTWLYPAWSALNGGKIYDAANNKYMLDSEQNVQWLDYWLKWLDNQYGGDIEKLNQAATWDDVYPKSAFSLGKAAMSTSGSWATTDADIPFQWEVAKLPVGPGGTKSVTGFYPNWWVIPQGSKNPDEAFLFIEYISTKGWETWYQYIMDTPAWKQFPLDVVTTKLVETTSKERAVELNTFFADYLTDAAEMWNSPIESFSNDTLSAAIDQVLHKKKSPKDALAEAQSVCQAKLEATLKG